MTYSDGSVVKNLLPTQKTRVQSQIQEDSTCHSATKPVCCNCWACGLQLRKPSLPKSALHKRSHHNATERSPSSPKLEKAHVQQRRPSIAKDEWMNQCFKKILFKKQGINGNMICWKHSEIWFFKFLHFDYTQKTDLYSGKLSNANLFIFAGKLYLHHLRLVYKNTKELLPFWGLD